ncbi:MAG: putative Ig domain-containing protein, partial [Planctomycetes bacterium]|nr:putative Ig domain-containing protein [Planctomycetota bacterium]
ENRSNTFSVILGTSAALTVDFSQLVMVAGSGLTDLAGNGVVQSSAVIQSGSASSTSIDLITLNGEPVEEFTSVNIEWQTKPNSDDWTIDIALNLGGDLYLELATGVEDTGLFVWSVPGEITGPGYTVLITGHNATIEEDFTDESSASFSIVPAGSLNNGEVPDFVTILDIDIPDGEVGIDYEADMIAIGGVAPFVWTVESGSLPGGLDINDSTGDISGTPTDSGVSTFTVLVTDADGNTASRSFQITVVDALELLVMELPSGVVGEAYSATLIATGGGEPLSWEISSGSLPTGVSLEGGDDGEETLAGTVSGSEGRFVFTVTVTDELGGERSGVFQITVVSTSRLISSNDTGLFSIAPVSGAQLEISGTGLRGFRDVQALAFDSENGVYYASDIDSGTLLRLDPETGLGTLIGTIGFSDVRALAYNTANDTLYGIDTAANELITISTATGAGTSVGTVNGGFTDIGSLAVDPSSSTLYAVATNVDKLITINTSNANASEVGVVGLDNVQALTFNSAESGSDKLFGVDLNSGDLITINVSTGAGTSVDTLGVDDIRGLAYDASAGTLIGVAATTAQVVEIDTTTAETDNIGSVGFDFADLAYHSTNEVIYGINTLTNELVAIDPDTYFPAVVGEIGVGTIEGLAYRAATNTLYGSDTSTGRLVVISAT